MIEIAIRFITSVLLAFLLATFGIVGNPVTLQFVFLALILVFCFSIRGRKSGVNKPDNKVLAADFIVSVLVVLIATLWCGQAYRYTFYKDWNIDVLLTAVMVVSYSLLYQIYCFVKLPQKSIDLKEEPPAIKN